MTIVLRLLHERRHSDRTSASSKDFEVLYPHKDRISAGYASNLMLFLHKDADTHEGR